MSGEERIEEKEWEDLLNDHHDASLKALKPPADLRHPLQRQMQDRMDRMISIIKGEGKTGMEEGNIKRIMFVNYGVSVRLTKEYLSTLVEFGRLRKEGSVYFCTEEEG